PATPDRPRGGGRSGADAPSCLPAGTSGGGVGGRTDAGAVSQAGPTQEDRTAAPGSQAVAGGSAGSPQPRLLPGPRVDGAPGHARTNPSGRAGGSLRGATG